jgi:hypothetical protein
MKKYILNCLLVLFAVNVSFAQTTATNFTTDDCNGISHNLFDELDNGNVVVIAWVMPCTPCATYSLPAYSAVQSFATSHPGQVHFYMADDYANTSCTSLSSWGDNYNMSNSTFFSSTDLDMNDYGVAGMPKVVVLGGLDHHVYFNENDNKINLSGVQTAIDSALNSFISSNSDLASTFQLNTFPNPTQDKLKVNYHFNKDEEVTFEIIDLLGMKVQTVVVSNIPGTHTEDLNVSELPSANYILRMQTSERTENIKFTISK